MCTSLDFVVVSPLLAALHWKLRALRKTFQHRRARFGRPLSGAGLNPALLRRRCLLKFCLAHPTPFIERSGPCFLLCSSSSPPGFAFQAFKSGFGWIARESVSAPIEYLPTGGAAITSNTRGGAGVFLQQVLRQ